MNNLCSNTAALRIHDSDMDKADRLGELLEINREKIVERATELAWEGIQLQDEDFIAVVQAEQFRDGDFDQVNIDLCNIEKAGRKLDSVETSKALINFATFMYRKYTDQMIAKKWEQAEADVARELT